MDVYWETGLGMLIIGVALADVFLTVLYARLGSDVVSAHVARFCWWCFQLIGRRSRHRPRLLSFCGPAVLIAFIIVWAALLTIGSALLVHPRLGNSIVAAQGPTPTDFAAALEVAATSLSVLGSSDFNVQSAGMRVFFALNSVVGISVTFVALTYVMQVYNALHRRNALALKLHLASGETGDAVEVVRRLGPGGRFELGHGMLLEMGAQMVQVAEAHHFYPTLIYFRFPEPFYGVARFSSVALDTVALVRALLPEGELGWLKASGGLEEVERATNMLVALLCHEFAQRNHGESRALPEDAAWRGRLRAAREALQRVGLPVNPGPQAEDTYVALRCEWDAKVKAVARIMAYEPHEYDPATARHMP